MENVKVILVVLLLSVFSPLYSQLKINDVGNVLIHSAGTTETPSDQQAKLAVKKASSTSSNSYGVNVYCHAMGGVWNYGISSLVGSSTSTTSSGRAFGIMGAAGYHTSGYNYGVLGSLNGTNYGAGIYGSIGNYGNYVPGRYAGYFDGNVMVTGTINGIVLGTSDIRLKENIVELSSKTALSNLMKMNSIEYNYKQTYQEVQSDTGMVKAKLFDADAASFKKKQYGLSAQELQKIYPDLVYEQDNGYLAINYTGLIPILIQAVKELKEEVNLLKEENYSLVKKANSLTGVEVTSQGQIAVLYQNIPNPFSATTQIKYYLPDDVNKAFLLIYDMQGKQLKQCDIYQNGEGYIEISGDELNAGMYLYALIADGIEIDMKRMILTD